MPLVFTLVCTCVSLTCVGVLVMFTCVNQVVFTYMLLVFTCVSLESCSQLCVTRVVLTCVSLVPSFECHSCSLVSFVYHSCYSVSIISVHVLYHSFSTFQVYIEKIVVFSGHCYFRGFTAHAVGHIFIIWSNTCMSCAREINIPTQYDYNPFPADNLSDIRRNKLRIS